MASVRGEGEGRGDPGGEGGSEERRTDAEFLNLAGSEVRIPRLGVGTWAWGDRRTWGMGGYDPDLNLASIREAFQASIRGGATFFDTAEVYGDGESEKFIGRLLGELDEPTRARVVVATKFMPVPWKVRITSSLMESLQLSLQRLQLPKVDLYQIHGPISLRGHEAIAEALATAHDAGLVSAVGVSNYSEKETRTIHEALGKRGMSLATNQVEYSLLRRKPETGGLLEACNDLGVVVLAYSPLGQGRLTGKYTADSPPPGKRGFSAHPMEKVDSVVDVLRRIGERHSRSPSQVALRWIIEKGAVPIPGAKNKDQATANAGALGWSLTSDEVSELDEAALHEKKSVANLFWQHG